MFTDREQFKPDWPEVVERTRGEATHPSDHIREYLELKGWSQADLARKTGLSTGNISELMNKKRSVTPRVALKLEKAFGLKAHIWTGLQSNWDLYQLRAKHDLR